MADTKEKSPTLGATIPKVKTTNLKSPTQQQQVNEVTRAFASQPTNLVTKSPVKDPGTGNVPGYGKSLPKLGSAFGMAADFMGSFIDRDSNSAFDTQQQVGNVISQFNPIVGGAYKVTSAIGEATGLNSSFMTKEQANASGIGNFGRIANNVLSILPFAGIGSDVVNSELMTEEAKRLRPAYSGALNKIDIANSMNGNRFAIGGNRANGLASDANRMNREVTGIGFENDRLVSSVPANTQGISLQNMNRFAGQTYQQMGIGKNGLKFPSVEEVRAILASKKQDEVQSFHNGGVIGIDVNVIPEGKYHAHLNHLEEVSPELEGLTKKGIPVLTMEEGGEVQQIAEIERKEIIFRLEVTKKLEELFKDGSEDAMIEAGKLLAVEICENTQDNTGIMLDDGTEED